MASVRLLIVRIICLCLVTLATLVTQADEPLNDVKSKDPRSKLSIETLLSLQNKLVLELKKLDTKKDLGLQLKTASALVMIESELLSRVSRGKDLTPAASEAQKVLQHSLCESSLPRLAAASEDVGNWKTARVCRKDILTLTSHLYGKNHWKVIDARVSLNHVDVLEKLTPEQRELLESARLLHNQAAALASDGKYRQSLPLSKKAVAMHKKAMGEEHPNYATFLERLAITYKNLAEYAKALSLHEQARAIRKRTIGESHPVYASSLSRLAATYDEMSAYKKAMPLIEKCLAIQKKTLGEEDPQYATSLHSKAMICKGLGDYAQAQLLVEKSIDLCKKLHGEEHSVYASRLNSLGSLYLSAGKYGKAVPLYEKALAIRKKVLGKEHPDYAQSLSNRAFLYASMGEYAKAVPLYEQANAIDKKTLGEEHPNYATGLNNLAAVYESMRQITKALPLHLQAIAIREKTLGEDHPAYGASLNNLGHLFLKIGALDKARLFLKKARDVLKKSVGEEHPNYLVTLSNLERLYSFGGEYDQALLLSRKILAIRKKVQGEDHPDYAYSLRNLGMLYASMGQPENARPLFEKVLKIRQQQLELALATVSEAQALNLLQQNPLEGSELLFASRPPLPSSGSVYDTLWASKGILLKGLAIRQKSLLEIRNPEQQRQYQAYLQLRQRLAQIALSPSSGTLLQLKKRQDLTAKLNREKETAEKQLAQALPEFSQQLELARSTPQDLQQVMPAGTAFLDIRRYVLLQRLPEGDKKRWKAHFSYVAFVVTSKDVKRVELGKAADLEAHLKQWRAAIQAGQNTRSRDALGGLFQPVWKALPGNTSTLFISPDGALSGLPWAALPGRTSDRILLEDFAVATVPSGQFLLEKILPATGGEPVVTESRKTLLVGNVQFDEAASTLLNKPLLAQSSPPRDLVRSVTGSSWAELPATKEEILSVRKLLGEEEAILLEGTHATMDSVLRALSQVQVAHLATHGFFADGKFRSGFQLREEDFEKRFLQTRLDRRSTVARNPLLMSGVVLAGANVTQEKDDSGLPLGDGGILSAETIAGQNLRNLELVVLSACETGLGDVADGEGVFGLQRAFHLAGVPNVVGSLWKVNDQATSALMQLFYFNLQKGRSPLQALRVAQLELYHHPGLIPGWSKGQRLRAPKLASIPERPAGAPAVEIVEGKKSPVHLWASFILSGSGK